MKRIIIFTVIHVLLFASGSSIYAKEEDDLKAEIAKLEKELENVETLYWKQRYDLVELKKKAKDEMSELENEYNDMMKIRSSLKEEIVSMEVDNNALTEKNEEMNQRIAELYSTYLKVTEELRFFVKRNMPFTSDKDLLVLDSIEKDIRSKMNVIAVSNEIISFMKQQIDNSKKIDLAYDDIITRDNTLDKGTRLRIGYIFNGYVTESGNDAGILLHTGSVTRNAFEWHEDLSAGYRTLMQDAAKSVNTDKETVFLPFDVMQSKAVGKTYASKGSVLKRFLEWFKSGGIVMYAILFVLAYALFIIIERIVIFRKNRKKTNSINTLAEAIAKKDYKKALEISNNENSPVSGMIKDLLQNKKASKDEAEQKIQEVILHEIPVIQKHLPTLKSLAALAPLLGLLGTVTGMISLFDVITVFGNSDPKLLAGGIAEALVTTEFGLIVAIPVTLFHRVLLNSAEKIISDLERFSLSILSGWK